MMDNFETLWRQRESRFAGAMRLALYQIARLKALGAAPEIASSLENALNEMRSLGFTLSEVEAALRDLQARNRQLSEQNEQLADQVRKLNALLARLQDRLDAGAQTLGKNAGRK